MTLPRTFLAKAQRNTRGAKRSLPYRLRLCFQLAGLIILLSPLASLGQKAAVETVQFQSQLVNTKLPYNVLLPPGYRTASTTRYPVLYLLHGLGGHYSDWATRTNVADYAAQYRLIVVMPEGNDSWNVDSAGVLSDKN